MDFFIFTFYMLRLKIYESIGSMGGAKLGYKGGKGHGVESVSFSPASAPLVESWRIPFRQVLPRRTSRQSSKTSLCDVAGASNNDLFSLLGFLGLSGMRDAIRSYYSVIIVISLFLCEKYVNKYMLTIKSIYYVFNCSINVLIDPFLTIICS